MKLLKIMSPGERRCQQKNVDYAVQISTLNKTIKT